MLGGVTGKEAEVTIFMTMTLSDLAILLGNSNSHMCEMPFYTRMLLQQCNSRRWETTKRPLMRLTKLRHSSANEPSY